MSKKYTLKFKILFAITVVAIIYNFANLDPNIISDKYIPNKPVVQMIKEIHAENISIFEME